ncbi:MAG: ABC transporter permease [Chloroflexota bacterium]
MLTLWAIVTLNFLLPRLMPGDPLDALQDPATGSFLSDDTVRAHVLGYYGLDRPFAEQYVTYLADLARGDLGWSIRLNTPVSTLIAARLPWTALLVLPSLTVATTIATLAGVESAWARGSARDRGLVVLLTVLHSMPVFVLGVIAIGVVGVQLAWLPLSGASTPFRVFAGPFDAAGDIAQHWLLPAGVLTLEMASARFLVMRNSMIGVLNDDFIAVARAKGVSERWIKYRHALPNALLPSVTTLAGQVGFALGGAVFVETLFAYPGMGRLLSEAVSARDYPVLQGAFLMIALTTVGANALAELSYGRLDPRTRG